jgi:hypothetical protein
MSVKQMNNELIYNKGVAAWQFSGQRSTPGEFVPALKPKPHLASNLLRSVIWHLNHPADNRWLNVNIFVSHMVAHSLADAFKARTYERGATKERIEEFVAWANGHDSNIPVLPPEAHTRENYYPG